jgi:hypothetical protein
MICNIIWSLINDSSDLVTHQNIQTLLRKQHHQNVIIRIKNYTGSITPHIIQLASKKIDRVDVMEVKYASAGAATFYQWVRL